jgi:hypothetical protein
MSTQLFEVQIRVHPTREHPQFGAFDFGLLCMWLYSADRSSAATEAVIFARRLPYRLGPVKSFNVEWANNPGELRDYEVDGAVKAAKIGFSIELITWPPATTEEDALGNWPFIVPTLPKG